MWSQRDPSLRKSGVGNVYVKNLDKSIDHKALYDIFSKFGNILSCKVTLDTNNNSKGFGFVHFETQESANKAIQEVNQQVIKGKEVFVGPFIPKKERSKSEDKFTNVFVKNLDESVNEEKLRELFGKYGTITSAYVSYSPEKKSKCFGFVNFENHEQALAAIEGLNQTTPIEGGKQVFVGKAQKKSDRVAELRQKFEHKKDAHGVNVFVKNIDGEMDEEKLKEEFSPYGSIVSAKVMKDDKGKNRGYGFICFKTKEEAHKAIYEFRKKNSAGLPIFVAMAHRKDSRDRQHQRNPRNNTNNNNSSNNNRGHYQQSNRGQRQNTGGGGGGRNYRRYGRGGGGGGGGEGGRNSGGGQKQDRKNNKANKQEETKASTTAPTTTAAATNEKAPTSNNGPQTIQDVAEQLYPLVLALEGELAGKITGMLMSRYQTVEELGVFLKDQNALKEKVDEAVQVLKQAQQQPEAAEQQQEQEQPATAPQKAEETAPATTTPATTEN
jgi:polyadenylate-binding protein